MRSLYAIDGHCRLVIRLDQTNRDTIALWYPVPRKPKDYDGCRVGEEAEAWEQFLDDREACVSEALTCNDIFEWICPSETGDLTDAPMLAIRETDDPLAAEFEPESIIARWAYMSYQVRDCVLNRSILVKSMRLCTEVLPTASESRPITFRISSSNEDFFGTGRQRAQRPELQTVCLRMRRIIHRLTHSSLTTHREGIRSHADTLRTHGRSELCEGSNCLPLRSSHRQNEQQHEP